MIKSFNGTKVSSESRYIGFDYHLYFSMYLMHSSAPHYLFLFSEENGLE